LKHHFQQLARDEPPEFATAAASRLLQLSLVYHVVLALLFILLGAMVLRLRNKARIALTLILALGALGTAFSFSSATPADIGGDF
jgi:hypothetical protein